MRNFASALTICIILCFDLEKIAVFGEEGKTWALLVASAKGWGSYAMQADVYHAYHVLREGGIPKDQIVVMAYDDIAYNENNPYKGQVFQSYDLKDVYKGVVIDYKKELVNKHTFFAVLQGDTEVVKNLTGSSKKVIHSGPDDSVFVFISNHGAPGMVCWLDGDDMTAKELNDAIANMHKNIRYKNMVLYVDTCFAGSMFKNILPSDIGVYAVTSTNATDFAYSTECNSDVVKTCLGGLFSINWIYEVQSDNRRASTMDMQFHEAVIACRGYSIPQQYGDFSVATKKQTEFFGDSAFNVKPVQGKRTRRSAEKPSVIPKHMLSYQILKNKLDRLSEGSKEYQTLAAQLSQIETLMGHADQFINDVSTAVYGPFVAKKTIAWAETHFGLINWSCYEPVVKAVRAQCPKMMNTEDVRYYAGAKFGVLVNLCNEVRTDSVLAAVKAAATNNPLCGV